MHRVTPPLKILAVVLFALFAQIAVAQTTWSRVEESSDWQTCGNCGNTAGTGDTATYSMERGITSPALDGSSTQFKVGGTYAYKNAYWYIKRYDGPTTPVTYLKYDFYLYVPSSYATAPHGIEFELQQKVGGYVYNFAWQAEYPKHAWRTFDYVTRAWVYSGVAFNGFTGGKWHHVTAEFHAANHEAVYDSLTIDGVKHALNIHHAAKTGTTGHYLSNGFQLDLNSTATDFYVYVDKMQITFK